MKSALTEARKLTATFESGQVLTRTTKTPSLSHAWYCEGANYWKTDKSWHSWEATGFSSSQEKAHKAASACGLSPKRIDKIEIVECAT